MPKLLVRAGLKGHQKFELKPGDTIIGRGDDATLRLPNVSVSRHHCRIEMTPSQALLVDMESQNGTLLNNKPIEAPALLKTGDEVRVGKFSLIYLTDDKKDRFFRGRFVEYLPEYEPTEIASDEASTFAMSKEALKAMANQDDVVENARLVLDGNTKKFWFPEARKLTFGGKGMIEVEGWWTWGTCAEVDYDGSRHRVTRLGWMTSVEVNGSKVTKSRPLKDGDRLVIGTTRFKYTLD